MTFRKLNLALKAAWLGALWLLPACANGSLCPGLGACGGDLDGSWQSSDQQAPVCLDGPYYTPATVPQPGVALDLTRYGRPSPVAGQAPSPPTLAEWCDELVLQNDPSQLLLSAPSFQFQDAPIAGFTIGFDAATRSYSAGFARVGRFSQYYSSTCISRFGQDPDNCPGVQAALLAVDPNSQASCSAAPSGGCSCTYQGSGGAAMLAGAQLTCSLIAIVLNNAPNGAPAQKNADGSSIYNNVACVPSSGRSGCDCGFDVSYRTEEKGSYKVVGTTVTTYPLKATGSPGNGKGGLDYSAEATFCQRGDELELSGAGAAYLLNRAPLRTVRLFRQAP
ncbi:MAG TPA: hypothetical protein VHB79_39665 [Polyangiaceae bacterium]|nr:hypothetical protein [Polyangiaceae bacterium]